MVPLGEAMSSPRICVRGIALGSRTVLKCDAYLSSPNITTILDAKLTVQGDRICRANIEKQSTDLSTSSRSSAFQYLMLEARDLVDQGPTAKSSFLH